MSIGEVGKDTTTNLLTTLAVVDQWILEESSIPEFVPAVAGTTHFPSIQASSVSPAAEDAVVVELVLEESMIISRSVVSQSGVVASPLPAQRVARSCKAGSELVRRLIFLVTDVEWSVAAGCM